MSWQKYDKHNPPKPGTLIRNAREPSKEFYCMEGSGIANGTVSFADWEVWVDELPITLRSPQPSGLACNRCKDFYPYAEPNQKDGSLLCWSCRSRYH